MIRLFAIAGVPSGVFPCLVLASFIVPVEAQTSRSLTNEDMFFYKVAVCGDRIGDQVEFWGGEFDRSSYQIATANEFSRQQYRERTRAMLQKRLDSLSFGERFSAVFSGELGEYSFSDHGFPVRLTSHLRFSIGG